MFTVFLFAAVLGGIVFVTFEKHSLWMSWHSISFKLLLPLGFIYIFLILGNIDKDFRNDFELPLF